jgi:hypothetical protein
MNVQKYGTDMKELSFNLIVLSLKELINCTYVNYKLFNDVYQKNS